MFSRRHVNPGVSGLLLGLAVSCADAIPADPAGKPSVRRPAASAPSLAPRPASAFVCDGATCLQRHVRLPDDGEWRCAEQGGVVWCAGGEPAAGVVNEPTERGYRCGPRRGSKHVERVCVDTQPDYPEALGRSYSCRFAQERGVMRECRELTPPPGRQPAPPRGVPECWLDQDCSPRRCDRGSCAGDVR